MRTLNKTIAGLCIILWCLGSSCGQKTTSTNDNNKNDKEAYSPEDMKKMSEFVYQYTHLNIYNFDIKTATPDELISIALFDNAWNHHERFLADKTGSEPDSIDKVYIEQSLKELFDIDFKDHGGEDYDGQFYHCYISLGDLDYIPTVTEAERTDSGEIRMAGTMYNSTAPEEYREKELFEVIAKPHNDSWILLSIKSNLENGH